MGGCDEGIFLDCMKQLESCAVRFILGRLYCCMLNVINMKLCALLNFVFVNLEYYKIIYIIIQNGIVNALNVHS